VTARARRLWPLWILGGCALLVLGACGEKMDHSVAALPGLLTRAASAADTGLIMSRVDLGYQDELGGPGRLEEDLHQIYSVYGPLKVRWANVQSTADSLKGSVEIEGKGLEFVGPLTLKLGRTPGGLYLTSGVFEELRGVLATLRERRIAVEDGAADRMWGLISRKYGNTPDESGRDQIIDRLRKEFLSDEARGLITQSLRIQVTGQEAQAEPSLIWLSKKSGKTLKTQKNERLLLIKDKGSWRFIGGL